MASLAGRTSVQQASFSYYLTDRQTDGRVLRVRLHFYILHRKPNRCAVFSPRPFEQFPGSFKLIHERFSAYSKEVSILLATCLLRLQHRPVLSTESLVYHPPCCVAVMEAITFYISAEEFSAYPL
jgi:hypothetical protein